MPCATLNPHILSAPCVVCGMRIEPANARLVKKAEVPIERRLHVFAGRYYCFWHCPVHGKPVLVKVLEGDEG